MKGFVRWMAVRFGVAEDIWQEGFDDGAHQMYWDVDDVFCSHMTEELSITPLPADLMILRSRYDIGERPSYRKQPSPGSSIFH